MRDKELDLIWNEAKNVLASEMSVFSWEIWIKSIGAVEIRGNSFVLDVGTATKMKTISTKFKTQIITVLRDITGFIDDIILEYDSQPKEDNVFFSPSESTSDEKENEIRFDTNYTFDNFVVGKSNEIAFHAAKSVAENPGSKANPLFIYGGVGLGKTHIIHSIGNYILRHNPKTKILYVTTEQFINDYIDSIKSNKDNESNKLFREKYRNVDVLMLDDIQFLAGKQSTQEALFHTFNDLYQRQKQIIITSDRNPKELTFLEDRLRSRFQTGMSADISAPDIETRIAILQRKALQNGYSVHSVIIEYIASKFSKNIREMEGSLKKVVFFADLHGKKLIDINIAKEALKDDVDETVSEINVDKIIEKVCDYYHVTKGELIGKKKTKNIVEPRQISMYLISDMLSIPLVTIGEIFGGRDHTTIIYARDKIAGMLQNDKVNKIIKDIRGLINS